MNTKSWGKTSGSTPGEMAEALGDAAEIIAKSIEATAGPLAELIEARANEIARSVEGRATPLAEVVGATVEQLAKSVESRAVPAARAVGAKADALTDDLEERLERARQDVTAGVKKFKFGQRKGIILGLAVGLFAAVWLIRKVDREAAAARLRAAGSRAGDVAQGLTDKASALAGQAGERMGHVAQNVGTRAGELVQQVRGQGADIVEEAKLRLSGGAGTVEDAEIGSGLDEATRAAISEVVEEVEQVQEEAQEQARELGLSNGMKVVAFDGTDIGRVQEVREAVFVLDRPKGSDLLVPLTEVARIEGTVAYLRIDIGQVIKMGWEAA